jgi:hypothetical protein
VFVTNVAACANHRPLKCNQHRIDSQQHRPQLTVRPFESNSSDVVLHEL